MVSPKQASPDFSRLTVIIPTYNERHHFVLRTVKHWSQTSARVVIVDESKNAMPPEQRRLLPESATYHHLPSLFLLERMQYAASLVDTEFILISPDDSFHIHDAVSRCMAKLEADPEILACNGIYCHFSRFSRFRNTVICLAETSDVRESDSRSESIRQRLVASCNTVFLYGVVRRSVMQTCLSMLASKYSAAPIGFHVFQFGLAYMGKWDSIRELMWFRSYERGFASSRGVDRRMTFYQWYTEPAYASEVEDTLSRMESVLARETQDAPSAIRQELRGVCEYNARLSLAAATEEHATPELWRRVISAVLPPRAKNVVRRVKHRLVPDGIPLARHLQWLREHDVAIDEQSVADVERKILSSMPAK